MQCTANIVLQTGNFTGIAKANELNGKSLTTELPGLKRL